MSCGTPPALPPTSPLFTRPTKKVCFLSVKEEFTTTCAQLPWQEVPQTRAAPGVQDLQTGAADEEEVAEKQ